MFRFDRYSRERINIVLDYRKMQGKTDANAELKCNYTKLLNSSIHASYNEKKNVE